MRYEIKMLGIDFLMDRKITILPLGAGQDVGRSCILVSMGGYTVMFDCGMHMVPHSC